MLGSMLCWGSWANTMKLTPGFPFQLFYWDYIVGIIVASLFWGHTLGSMGGGPSSFMNNIHSADTRHVLFRDRRRRGFQRRKPPPRRSD